MGQGDILGFLKKNPNAFFSAEDISRLMEINFQSSKATLNRLKEAKDVQFKVMFLGKTNHPTEMYSFRDIDSDFNDAINELNKYKNDNEFQYVNSNSIIELLTLKELKKIRRLLEHGSKEQV